MKPPLEIIVWELSYLASPWNRNGVKSDSEEPILRVFKLIDFTSQPQICSLV